MGNDCFYLFPKRLDLKKNSVGENKMVGARHLMTIITQGSLAPTLSSPPSTRVSRLTKFSKFKKKQRFGLQPSRSLKAIETKRRVADNLEGVANDWNEELRCAPQYNIDYSSDI